MLLPSWDGARPVVHVFRGHGAGMGQAAIDIAELLDVMQVLFTRQQGAGAQVRVGRRPLARLGRRDGARRTFEEATRRAPHQGEAWNGLGAMRLQAGDADAAIGPLQQAAALLPDDPNPSLNLGRAYENLERFDEAARAFREALRRAPGNHVAMEHLMRLVPAAQRERVMRRYGTTESSHTRG